MKGPNGEKRPADGIARSVLVAKIATGEIEDCFPSKKRNSGIAGAKARKNSLSAEDRKAISVKAAEARWSHKTAA